MADCRADPVLMRPVSLEARSRSISDFPVVVVRMRVFSVLRMAPRGVASCTNQVRKKRTSPWCMRLLQSPT
jgi:hypothetical protein